MAKTENLNIRIDPELKKNVEETLKNIGMNLTEAITIYLHQIVLHGGIPFEIKNNRFNVETLNAIYEAKKIAEDSEAYYYDSIDELMEDLDN